MTSRTRAVCLALLLCGAGACTQIPEADMAFLDREVPVGTDAATARARLRNRHFAPAEPLPPMVSMPGLAERATYGVGFVKLDGTPDGNLSCFERRYSFPMLFAAGKRLICWTVEPESDRITWRQAGWRGISL
ncbi:hypothetical protein LVO79_11830 [Roseivivax marinus]|uniref:hypothetical protein n=1 Tax=Roseivivax marinus TaxID=1379903 RepID=UPI001F04D462|nr:hypothetical protein [Roseivivax marinus]UMA63721.1 hypothetical protein LVO79_11830 [Roseivivax marinus]